MAAPSGQDNGGIISGINVTPLVDVMLVLLVIFIVTAKIIVTPAVPLDLPHAAHGEEVQVVLSVILPVRGPMLVNGARPAQRRRARGQGARRAAGNPELRAVIQADGHVPHWRVIRALDQSERRRSHPHCVWRAAGWNRPRAAQSWRTPSPRHRTQAARIVDLVFAADRAEPRRGASVGHRRRWSPCTCGGFAFLDRLGGRSVHWGAELAARVHDAIAMERAIETRRPPPPPSPVPSPAAARGGPRIARRRTHRAPDRRSGAGRAARRRLRPIPVDFTGSAFIVGTAPIVCGRCHDEHGNQSEASARDRSAPAEPAAAPPRFGAAHVRSRSTRPPGTVPGPPKPMPSRSTSRRSCFARTCAPTAPRNVWT